MIYKCKLIKFIEKIPPTRVLTVIQVLLYPKTVQNSWLGCHSALFRSEICFSRSPAATEIMSSALRMPGQLENSLVLTLAAQTHDLCSTAGSRDSWGSAAFYLVKHRFRRCRQSGRVWVLRLFQSFWDQEEKQPDKSWQSWQLFVVGWKGRWPRL